MLRHRVCRIHFGFSCVYMMVLYLSETDAMAIGVLWSSIAPLRTTDPTDPTSRGYIYFKKTLNYLCMHVPQR